MSDTPGLSGEELRVMFNLLARFAAAELDQFELWRFATPFGDVFIDVRRTPLTDASSYDDITSWLEGG